jgi:hypothetical protein
MKKSSMVTLVLISAALSRCHVIHPSGDLVNHDPVYWDNSLNNDAIVYDTPDSNVWIWHYAFRPYGTYYFNRYQHMNGGKNGMRIHFSSRFAHAPVSRGGFGKGSSSVS